MSETPKSKKSIFDYLKNVNVKIGIVIAFFVGWQTLSPIIKDVLGLDDDIQAVISECNSYTDKAIDKKQNKAEKEIFHCSSLKETLQVFHRH